MRFSSRGRKALSVVLAAFTAASTAATGVRAGSPAPEGPRETCLLLKYAAPGVPDADASRWADALRKGIERRFPVRWADARSEEPGGSRSPAFPDARDGDLERVSAALSEAGRAMERFETERAKTVLEDAEKNARTFRYDGRIRPYLADLYLKKGMLRIWEGDRKDAALHFTKVRVLLPGFRPDPAIFSPQAREVWEESGARGSPKAEVLVRSIPPGADVSYGGEKKGKSPLRIGITAFAPGEIRVEMPGYRTAFRERQWLPGDAETVDLDLQIDPYFRLGEALGRGDEGEATRFLEAVAAETGAGRALILLFTGDRGNPSVKVLTWRRDGGEPETVWDASRNPGDDDIAATAGSVADRLAAEGWPGFPGVPIAEKPWYYKVLPWVLIGVAVIGVASGLGGGGGGETSGGSTGTVGVNF